MSGLRSHGLARGPRQHLRPRRQRFAPRHNTIDLDLDGEAEHRTNEHDHPEDGRIGQRRLRRDGLDDVCGNEQFQAEQNGTADGISKRLEGASTVGSLPCDGGQTDRVPGPQHHRRNAQYLERLRRPLEEQLQVHVVSVVDLFREPSYLRGRMVGDDDERQARRAHDKLAALPGVRPVRRPVVAGQIRGVRPLLRPYRRGSRCNPLVIIPGGTGCGVGGVVRGLRRHAAAKGLDVIMVDHRGVGMSRHDDAGADLPPEAITIDQAVNDIAAVLDDAQRRQGGDLRHLLRHLSRRGSRRAPPGAGARDGARLAGAVGPRHRRRAQRHPAGAAGTATDPEAAELAPKVRQLVDDGVLTPSAGQLTAAMYGFAGPRGCWPVNSICSCAAARCCGRVHRSGTRGCCRTARRRTATSPTWSAGSRSANWTMVRSARRQAAGPSARRCSAGQMTGPATGIRSRTLRPGRRDAEVHAGRRWCISGGRDLTTPPAVAERIASLIPESVLVELPTAGAQRRSTSASGRPWSIVKAVQRRRDRTACLPRATELDALPARPGLRLLVCAIGAAAAIESALPAVIPRAVQRLLHEPDLGVVQVADAGRAEVRQVLRTATLPADWISGRLKTHRPRSLRRVRWPARAPSSGSSSSKRLLDLGVDLRSCRSCRSCSPRLVV